MRSGRTVDSAGVGVPTPGRSSLLSRRRTLALLAGTAGSVALAGCGVSSGPPDALGYVPSDLAGARLSVIMRNSFIPLVNDVTAEQGLAWSLGANASIDFSFSNDWRERYREVAALRRGEDIAELFSISPQDFGDRLVDVSELAEEVGQASGGWVSAARSAAVVDGVWRAIPWAYTTHAINYRVSVLDAAGVRPPDTYDDLLEVATALYEQRLPLAGLTMSDAGPNDSANLAYSMLWSFGGQEVDEETGLVALDSHATRDALGYFRDLSAVTDPAGATYGEAENNDAFLNGEISLTQNASSIFWRARNDFPDVALDMGHTRYPSGPRGGHQLLEMNALAIFDHSRNKEAALDFIRFLTDPTQLRRRSMVAQAFFIPPLRDYIHDVEMPWNTTPELQGIGDTGETGHLPGWPGPSGKEAELAYQNGTIVRMFSRVADGTETIDSAVRLATRELKRVYET